MAVISNPKNARSQESSKTISKKGLGIKGRLMLSFGLVALTTVLAGGVGLLSYESIQSASLKVTDESVPAMTNAFTMVEQATALRSLATTMAGVADQGEYTAAVDRFASRREDMAWILEGIAETAIPKENIEKIDTLKTDLFNALQDLADRVEKRLQAAEQRGEVLAAVAEDHSRLTDWLIPQIDDAGFELVIETQSTTEGLGSQIEMLMGDGVSRLQSALTLRAEVNLMASILIEAAVAPDRGTLEAAADRFTAVKASVDEQMSVLNEDGSFADLEEPINTLSRLGAGTDGLFATRRASFENDVSEELIDPLIWAKRIYGPRETILQQLEPIVDEASFDLIILSESAVTENAETINQLIDHSVGNLRGLLGIAADANWLAGLLHQASMEQDRAALGPLVEQFNAAIEHLGNYRDMLSLRETAKQELDGLLQPLLARTAGSDSVIDRRADELDILTRQLAAVELTEDIAAMLTQAVNEVVEFAYVDVQQSSNAVQEAITGGRWLLAVLSLVSLIIAVAVVTLYVGPNIVAPLANISQSVGRLARGEDVTVPGASRQDELGDLARSLGVIHDQAIEATRIKLALDSSDSPVMVTDATHKIIYVNARLDQMFKIAESDFRAELEDFDAENLVGESLDFVYRLKSPFKAVIENLDAPHHESLRIGHRHLRFVASPVREADGHRLGSVLQWQDETDERQLREAISSVVKAASAGDFSKRVETVGIQGTMADLAGGINHLAELFNDATTDLGQMLASLAQGDLTKRIDKDYEGALGELKDNANRTADQLGHIVSQIHDTTSAVGKAAVEINDGTSDLSQRTEQAASNLEEIAGSTEEMSTMVKQNAENAVSANDLADVAYQTASRGGDIVERAVIAMGGIEESAQKITDIIGVIDEIAFQTNLLALNASVEAARAGEAGKGFAVVAQEVRQLAQRSAKAASDIKILIQNSNGKVDEGVKLVSEAGAALSEIVGSVGKVASIVQSISSASREQAMGTQEISSSITSMDEMTQQNATLVEKSSAAASALSKQATNLAELMAFFRSGENRKHGVAQISGANSKKSFILES